MGEGIARGRTVQIQSLSVAGQRGNKQNCHNDLNKYTGLHHQMNKIDRPVHIFPNIVLPLLLLLPAISKRNRALC